jgi:transcriptional regulator with XRE-family HTH domain
VGTAETIGKRIERLRIGKGWSRPQLGREMAKAIGRKSAFTGELIRLYEQGKNRPRSEARRALSEVFGKGEQYIEFGESGAHETREPAEARYDHLAPDVERLIRAFSWLTTDQQKKLLETLEADATTNKAIAKQLGPKFEFAKDERVLGILEQGGDFPPGKKRTVAKAGKRRPPFKEEDPE